MIFQVLWNVLFVISNMSQTQATYIEQTHFFLIKFTKKYLVGQIYMIILFNLMKVKMVEIFYFLIF